MKEKIDNILGKFISKKLTVFIIACVFLSTEKLLGEQWINVAMVYIGSQAAVDMLLALRR